MLKRDTLKENQPHFGVQKSKNKTDLPPSSWLQEARVSLRNQHPQTPALLRLGFLSPQACISMSPSHGTRFLGEPFSRRKVDATQLGMDGHGWAWEKGGWRTQGLGKANAKNKNTSTSLGDQKPDHLTALERLAALLKSFPPKNRPRPPRTGGRRGLPEPHKGRPREANWGGDPLTPYGLEGWTQGGRPGEREGAGIAPPPPLPLQFHDATNHNSTIKDRFATRSPTYVHHA